VRPYGNVKVRFALNPGICLNPFSFSGDVGRFTANSVTENASVNHGMCKFGSVRMDGGSPNDVSPCVGIVRLVLKPLMMASSDTVIV
jgi:hypothetical protein